MGKRFDDFMENFWRNFDKILLAVLFMVTLTVAVWVTMKNTMDESSLDWARSTANLILGGLLGLVTDRLIRGKDTQVTETIQTIPPITKSTTTETAKEVPGADPPKGL